MISTVYAAGAISDAPRLSDVLLGVLGFLLSTVGILGIVGLVLAGGLYLFALGDKNGLRLAKAAATASVIGIVIGFGAGVLVRALAGFFVPR
jgi:hypothetical protein